MHFGKKKANKSAAWRQKPQQNYIQTLRFLFCKRIQEFKSSF